MGYSPGGREESGMTERLGTQDMSLTFFSVPWWAGESLMDGDLQL